MNTERAKKLRHYLTSTYPIIAKDHPKLFNRMYRNIKKFYAAVEYRLRANINNAISIHTLPTKLINIIVSSKGIKIATLEAHGSKRVQTRKEIKNAKAKKNIQRDISYPSTGRTGAA